MTITRKPGRVAGAQGGKASGRAEDFIQAAETVPEPAAEPAPAVESPAVEAKSPADDRKAAKKDKKHKDKKKKSKKKEAVLIRFDNAQLARIDHVADSLGLSRAAWVRMVVAKSLPPA